jgi:hypothetical protein
MKNDDMINGFIKIIKNVDVTWQLRKINNSEDKKLSEDEN